MIEPASIAEKLSQTARRADFPELQPPRQRSTIFHEKLSESGFDAVASA